jgi:hypothetical protein
VAATSGGRNLLEEDGTTLHRNIRICIPIDTASQKNGTLRYTATKTSELSKPLYLFGITTAAENGVRQTKSHSDPGKLTT